jgi:hypothetical protein
MRGASLRWAQELLVSVQEISVGAPSSAGRALSPASDRKVLVKYDGDVLHIIKQYPGCNDASVLAFLRARVHWFGRGTLIHNVCRPSLGTVHAAGRRLELAGKIKIRVDRSQQREMLRFYPNTPFWAAAWNG